MQAVEVAHFSAALVACAFAAATVAAASGEPNPRLLAVVVATGLAETIVAAFLALRATRSEEWSKALVVPGSILTSLAFVFFLGVLAFGAL